jgi:microcystin-dependent protein
MSEPFIGQIQPFGFDFAPRGWALCDGQLLPISQNTALFSLLGITYGGNGTTTFALPDLRGRLPMHQGTGPGLSMRKMGQKPGTEITVLTLAQMPSHNHAATATLTGTMRCNSDNGDVDTPPGHTLGRVPNRNVYSDQPPDSDMAANSVTVSGNVTVANNGGSQPFSIMNPCLVINWCIALVGLFPSRS